MGAVPQKNLAQLASVAKYLFASVRSPQAPTQLRPVCLGLSLELGHREERFLCITWPFGAALEDRPKAILLFRVGVVDTISHLRLHSENVFAFFGITEPKGAFVIDDQPSQVSQDNCSVKVCLPEKPFGPGQPGEFGHPMSHLGGRGWVQLRLPCPLNSAPLLPPFGF